jgi:hypothetical protein
MDKEQMIDRNRTRGPVDAATLLTPEQMALLKLPPPLVTPEDVSHAIVTVAHFALRVPDQEPDFPGRYHPEWREVVPDEPPADIRGSEADEAVAMEEWERKNPVAAAATRGD